jgi:hypothetical protein
VRPPGNDLPFALRNCANLIYVIFGSALSAIPALSFSVCANLVRTEYGAALQRIVSNPLSRISVTTFRGLRDDMVTAS